MAAIITVPRLRDLKNGPDQFHLVDVRSPSEYATGHIPGAVNMPMEQVQSRIPDLVQAGPVILVCQSGQRARMVAGLLEPCGKHLMVLDGGTVAWIKAGLPTVASSKTRWSLERQVRLGAGLLIVTGIILSLTASLLWISLVAFVGLGLTFSGLTDLCPMGILLGMMPWNRSGNGNVATRTANSGPCA